MTRVEQLDSPAQPIINVRQLYDRVVGGDETAVEEFYQYAKGSLSRFHFPNSVRDDLIQLTATKAATNFHNFQPPEDPEVFDHAVGGWIYAIARNNRADYWRYQTTRPSSTIDQERWDEIAAPVPDLDQDSDDTPDTNQLLEEILREKAAQMLSPHIFSVVQLRMEGLEIPKIAQKLDLTEVNVRQRLVRGRRRLVKEFITPAGFQPVRRFGANVQGAAYDGRIIRLKFLGMYYVNEEDTQAYLDNRSMIIDQSVLDQGYVLSIDHLNKSEYQAGYLPEFNNFFLRHRGRLYIKLEDIALLKSKLRRAKPPRLLPPEPGYQRLASFTKNAHEYSIFYNAARTGRLQTIQQGRWWWTTKEAVDEFHRSKLLSSSS